MSKKTGKKPWNYMAGSEGSGQYVVIARTGRGKVGVRKLSNGCIRIRVEPFGARFVTKLSEHLSHDKGWKQPGDQGQNRFSVVTQFRGDMLQIALTAIGHNVLVSKTNDTLPDWARELVLA